MLDYLRLKFLRYIGFIAIAVIVLMLTTQFLGQQTGGALVSTLFLVLVSISTLLTFSKIKVEYLFSVIPILSLVIYVSLTQYYIDNYGMFMVNRYYLFPIYTFFLLGSNKGLIASLVLYCSIILHLFLNDFQLSLLGNFGVNFLYIFAFEILLLYSLEKVRNYILSDIREKTSLDDLTGISNRVGILQDLKDEFDKKTDFFFILTDFDHFAHINANLGHELSDKIIAEAAHVFKGDNNVKSIARWYGDRFSIMFNGSQEELDKYLKEKELQVRALSIKLEIEIEITFSCGYTEMKNGSISASDLIPYTEIALNEAKKGDRAIYHKFELKNLEDKNRALIIERDLVDSLKNGDIQLHFQPKVSTYSEKVTGMEALVRWNHPELGYIPPQEFVAVAERTGEIVPLGEFVIDTSFSHIKKCHEQGYKSLTVSVNVSPLHLLHTRFISNLNESALKFGVDPASVYLEITESVMLQGDMVIHLREIQRLGFNLSLDDFGTGYSSLNYLQKFSFNELKIDKSFTDGLLRGGNEIALFRTILGIAQSFGMKSVIEGLEDEQQLQLVREMGADEIQGWFFSKALTKEEFFKYIEKQNG